jgi:hypothetical protein
MSCKAYPLSRRDAAPDPAEIAQLMVTDRLISVDFPKGYGDVKRPVARLREDGAPRPSASRGSRPRIDPQAKRRRKRRRGIVG